MRQTSALYPVAITESHDSYTTAAIFYDGQLILDRLPVLGGTLSVDVEQQVPETVQGLLVPRYLTDPDTGQVTDLLPLDDTAPLAPAGQQVLLTRSTSLPGGGWESTDLPWLRIQDWSVGDDVDGQATIALGLVGLLAIVADARFLNAVQINAGTNMSAAAKQILEGLLPLKVRATDKPTSARTFEDDRLAALYHLTGAWPARMYVNDDGTLVIANPYDDTADPITQTFTDGQDGTVVVVPKSGTRDGHYNAVKASGESTGTNVDAVTATAYLSSGPRAWNGPYGNVPYFFTSPLLTTTKECNTAAKTRLNALQRRASPVSWQAVPDARTQTGDVVGLATATDRLVLRVDAVDLPLTYEGTMVVRGHVLAGRKL